jgi:L-ascorbate oxidase
MSPHLRAVAATILFCAAVMLFPGRVTASELREPQTLASHQGVLDLLMVARASPITTFMPFRPTGWIYDICRRPASGASSCPRLAADANLYGGTRLALEPGDLLRIHFVNQLPPVTDSEHAADPGEEFLALNPTNIHFHGMLVSPHAASDEDPTYGDYVFVLTFNPKNGVPALSPHMHGTVSMGSTDYSIRIPKNHPSGVYWFHPHAHGIALNQISSGLSGIVTVGSPGNYVCEDSACRRSGDGIPVRHLILKDLQVLADGSVQDEQDPDFCLAPAAVAAGNGSCAGRNQTASGGTDYRGGRWYFSVNGQVFPDITVSSRRGEIWRLVNSSGSATYDLDLHDFTADRDLAVQVLALDGVSVAPSAGMSEQELATVAGGKVREVPCPGVAPADLAPGTSRPLCADRLHMMPSSRVEVWVTYRDANGLPSAPANTHRVHLRQRGYNTGPDGDTWPAIDLAQVAFSRNDVADEDGSRTLFVGLHGQSPHMSQPLALASEMSAANSRIAADPSCHALPPGHRRRIFLNVPASDPNAFGLGYEEVDANGQPVPGTFMDVAAFDPMRATVCLPLGAGNSPSKEVWELVNLAGEDHNFHIHQVHFRVLSSVEVAGTNLPSRISGDGITMDNLPLAHADGTCVTVEDWRHGICSAHPALIEIPFAIAGDFVYHCHILEHEDGGMMARIRVRPNP